MASRRNPTEAPDDPAVPDLGTDTPDRYACVSCGSTFMRGYGPENIRVPDVGEPYRDGRCPVCNALNPSMKPVRR